MLLHKPLEFVLQAHEPPWGDLRGLQSLKEDLVQEQIFHPVCVLPIVVLAVAEDLHRQKRRRKSKELFDGATLEDLRDAPNGCGRWAAEEEAWEGEESNVKNEWYPER